MAGAGLKALVMVVVLVLVALVIDFNYIGSSLTEQFRFNHLATEVADKTTPTNNTTTPGTPPFFFRSLSLFHFLRFVALSLSLFGLKRANCSPPPRRRGPSHRSSSGVLPRKSCGALACAESPAASASRASQQRDRR